MVTLCAGGWASAFLTTGQTIKAMPDGTKGGDGVRSTTTGITGNHATGNGNGGGGAMAVADNGRCYSTGGNGSDGMVLIYKKVV